MINYSSWCFSTLFCFFFQSNVRDNMCYRQKWCKLFFLCIKLVAHVLASACAIASIKWRRLGSLPGIETLPRYEAPSDLWVKIIESTVINTELVKLSTQEWPKVDHGTAKLQLKKHYCRTDIFKYSFFPYTCWMEQTKLQIA